MASCLVCTWVLIHNHVIYFIDLYIHETNNRDIFIWEIYIRMYKGYTKFVHYNFIFLQKVNRVNSTALQHAREYFKIGTFSNIRWNIPTEQHQPLHEKYTTHHTNNNTSKKKKIGNIYVVRLHTLLMRLTI